MSCSRPNPAILPACPRWHLVDEDHAGRVAGGGRGQLAQGLAHQARLQAHVRVAHLAFDFGLGHQRRHRIDDDHVDGAGAHQLVDDFQSLLTIVGLGHQQVLDAHTQLARIGHVQGVLGVDEGADAARLLRLRDGVQGQRGLARRLGTEDFHHAAARQSAHAQGQVEPHRAGGNHGNVAGIGAPERHDGTLAKLLFNRG